MRSFFWQMALGKWQFNLANVTLHIGQISWAQSVEEIEWRFFCQTATFCLAHKGW